MAHQAFDLYGLWEQEPGDGTWDKVPGPTGRSRRETSAMHESATGGPQVPLLTGWLFLSVKSFENKSWARPVPAAAVTPAAQVVAIFIGPKAFVAGLISLWWNPIA